MHTLRVMLVYVRLWQNNMMTVMLTDGTCYNNALCTMNIFVQDRFAPHQLVQKFIATIVFHCFGHRLIHFFWGFDVRFKGVQNHRSIPTQLSVTYAQNTIMTYINVQDMRCYWKQWKAMLNIVSRYIPWSENAEMHMGSQLE